MLPDLPTTSGLIALRNLDAQIEAYQRARYLEPIDRTMFIDLILLRGHIRGLVSDAEAAAAHAQEFVNDIGSGTAFFVRAKSRAVFHLCSEALDDLDLAERHGMDTNAVGDERAAIFEAIGRYDDALALRREAVARARTFESVCALASIHAARGECDSAESLFADGRRRYRGVSPFALAALEFQRGHMWLAEHALLRARACFTEALARVPGYASAQGHAAQVDAELGDVEDAVARLRPFASSCDDPQYAAQLARILEEAGRTDEARSWREWATARYETLLERHLHAFADHAAEFWLWRDADLERALELASINLKLRNTQRARHLFARALVAHQRLGFDAGLQ